MKKRTPENRWIAVNMPNSDLPPVYASNKVITAKYTLISFLPLALFEQFRRFANLFFLLLIILQLFPVFMTVDPLVAALPTVIIVLAAAAKDGMEDLRRHSIDRMVNARQTKVARLKQLEEGNGALDLSDSATGSTNPTVGGYEWKKTLWHDLHVGDFVQLQNNDLIPADIVVLATSESGGICYVETKNLDGETNLKVRLSPQDTATLSSPEACCSVVMVVSCEPPNTNMYSFRGVLSLIALYTPSICPKPVERRKSRLSSAGSTLSKTLIEKFSSTRASFVAAATKRNPHETENQPKSFNPPPDALNLPITINGLLLRGSCLRNTKWVVGIIVYTGNDTKLQLNSGATKSKRSITETRMNPQVVINLLLLTVICITCAASSTQWLISLYEKGNPPYLPDSTQQETQNPAYNGFLAFWNGLIAFQNIVPISLYLTIEVVKSLQSYFIYSDIELYYEKTDTCCIPKSWNLADDLAQISYVFSDKTGTLTQNVMEFRRCSINGVVYGASLCDNQRPIEQHEAQYVVPNTYKKRSEYASSSPKFYDSTMWKDLDDQTAHSTAILEFWKFLAVCHTVLVSKPEEETSKKKLKKPESFDAVPLEYKAQSPDEAALVQTAKEIGITFTKRHDTRLCIDIFGTEMHFTLLAVLEFNSTRKRMSIISRAQNGKIILYCKGADSVIYERLHKNGDAIVRDMTLKHLEIFAIEGLRTLCLASREISEEEFSKWIAKYNEACGALDNRDAKIEAVAELIEQDLQLVGATAIEDRLQDGVPEAVQMLRDAGIKIWVLTGDKLETAISVGFSCNLLTSDLTLVTIRGDNIEYEHLKEAFTAFVETMSTATWGEGRLSLLTDDITSITPLTRKSKLKINTKANQALIIDGHALKIVLEHEDTKKLLLEMGKKCSIVLCCRVSPLQKAQVVQLVREGNHEVTCAIGDGANDVSMIQAAHIGVGISGQEGMQAAMSSDYAIGQFRHLTRLLIVHGRWSYSRISELILCYFYKDIVFVLIIFWFQFFAGFTTQQPFDFTFMLYYNLFFTNWPATVLGVFDQDIPANIALKVPQLYKEGIKQRRFTKTRFAIYMMEGILQSLIFYFVPFFAYFEGGPTSNAGYSSDMYEMGMSMAASSITGANIFLALNTRSFSWINIVALLVCSLGLFYVYCIIYFFIPGSVSYGQQNIIWPSPVFWLTLLISCAIALLPRYIYLFIQRNYYPTDSDIVFEHYKLGLDLTPLCPVHHIVNSPPSPQSALESKLTVRIPSSIAGPKSAPAEMSEHGSIAIISPSEITPRKRPHQRAVSMVSSTIRMEMNRGFTFSTDETGGMRNILMNQPKHRKAMSISHQVRAKAQVSFKD